MYRKCSVVAEKISNIIDGEAGIITRMRFHTHLFICPKCRDYFDQFKLLKQASNTPKPEELPDDFDQVLGFVMDEIDETKETKPSS